MTETYPSATVNDLLEEANDVRALVKTVRAMHVLASLVCTSASGGRHGR